MKKQDCRERQEVLPIPERRLSREEIQESPAQQKRGRRWGGKLRSVLKCAHKAQLQCARKAQLHPAATSLHCGIRTNAACRCRENH